MIILESYGYNLYKLIITVIVSAVIFFLRNSLVRLIRNFAEKHKRIYARTLLLIKYLNFLTFFLILAALVFIWGVNCKQVGGFMSSIFDVTLLKFCCQKVCILFCCTDKKTVLITILCFS